MKSPVLLLFYIPLVTNVLSIQGFLGKFVSDSLAQLFAYGNTSLLIIGVFFIIKKTKKFPLLIKYWIAFYLLYYSFALIANIYLGTEASVLRTLVPIIYFLSFSFLLSIKENFFSVGKTLAISFFVSCILLIIMDFYNFSMDYDGIYEYTLERAGGVYGDANNASVAAILSFIFLNHFFRPLNKTGKLLKTLAKLISIYAIILTFSKTGFVVFLIVLAITYHKLFSHQRILLSLIFVPLGLFLVVNWALASDQLSFSQKERVESLINLVTLQTDKVGLSDRDVLLQNMLNSVYEHPFLGNGVSYGDNIRGHNTIIGVWADAGVLTFLVFLILLVVYYKKSLSAPENSRYFALASLITLTIFMLTLQTIINFGNLMVVFVIIAYAVSYDYSFLPIKNKNALDNNL